MPKLIKTLLPRIKRSLAERGLWRTLLLAPVLPVHMLQERRLARTLAGGAEPGDFDLRHGVETDGQIGGVRTYLSDLEIPDANWIYGKDYSPIGQERFGAVMAGLNLRFEDFTFIDFGSGKGRALLLASELPFKRIIGVEFAPELHATAQSNIRTYASPTQTCKTMESVCMDFTAFELPLEPCLLYFFDPAREAMLVKVLENIRRSWREHPRPIYIVYISPLYEGVFNAADSLRKLPDQAQYWYRFYEVCG